MPSYQIYSATNDGLASTNQTTWAAMQSAASPNYTTDTIAAEANGIYVDSSSNNIDYVHNHSFDTSAVLGTITSADLSLATSSFGSGSAIFEARINNWATGIDWINANNWGSKTLSGSASFSPSTRTAITLTPSTVAVSSAFKLSVAAAMRRDVSRPANGDYRKVFYFAEEAGTTNDPYLSITTATRRAPRTTNWLF